MWCGLCDVGDRGVCANREGEAGNVARKTPFPILWAEGPKAQSTGLSALCTGNTAKICDLKGRERSAMEAIDGKISRELSGRIPCFVRIHRAESPVLCSRGPSAHK